MKFSKQDLKKIAIEQPENLVLLDNADLARLYRDETCDEQLQGNCLAELFVRWFVGDSLKLKEVERALSEFTPGGVPTSLLGMRTSQDLLQDDEVREALATPLWTCADAAEELIERIVRVRLRRLMLQVDGYVPVYHVAGDGMGLFLPFELIPRTAGRSPSAVDFDGKIVKDWNRPARDILGAKWTMRVFYRQRKEVPLLAGRSFLFPLLVARWRKEGLVPKFKPWQQLFTGEIDADGRTVPVKTEEKSAGAAAVFQSDVRLIAPSDSPYAREERGISPVPSGIAGEPLLNAVRSRIEQLRACRFSRDYALSRLPCLEHEIRQETVGEWDRQIACVDTLLKVLGKHVAPREHLRLVMLKSAAYCHSGRTSQALRENRRALSFARENGMAYEALRLEVEQLVEFQDSQCFDEIAQLAKPLAIRIRKARLQPEERLDLLMRYHGTIGQIQMEEALLGIGKINAAQAKSNLEKAHGYARELKRPGDELQDLNYLNLWYSFFEPAGPELVELQREIHGFIATLESEGERIKNLGYFRRQAMLALFMRWRLTGEVSSGWRNLKTPPEGSDGWLAASCMKMRGALAAAAGDAKTALRCFDEGEENFPCRAWWNGDGDELASGPVFAQIRLSLLVQAACSLAALGLEKDATDYRNKALELFEACPSLLRRVGAAACHRLLLAKNLPGPRSLPLFYY